MTQGRRFGELLQATNPSVQLYGEVVRAHGSSLVLTVNNVREIAAPLAHGIDTLHRVHAADWAQKTVRFRDNSSRIRTTRPSPRRSTNR